MTLDNPLLYAISNIGEIKRFNDCLSSRTSASMFLTSSSAISYFIGAISIKKRLVVVSDDSFSLYHGSGGIRSLVYQYVPGALDKNIYPSAFNVSKSKYVQTMAESLSIERPSVIYTEGNLSEHVPSSILRENNDGFTFLVNDKTSMSDSLARLISYGYNENIQTKNIGDCSKRGGILDIFPPTSKNPIRVEFDGDMVASIRYFNPISQLSIETTNEVIIPRLLNDINELLSVTYKDYFIDLGYSIVNVFIKNNSCEIRYDGDNNQSDSWTLSIKDITIKKTEEIQKISKSMNAVYVVGERPKRKDLFPDSAIHVGGYIIGNIVINESDIAVFRNDKNNKYIEKKEKRTDEYFYSYKWGDYITHVEHGIGIYRGLIIKDNKDYVKLEYAKNSVILLSTQRIDMIAPYIGNKNIKVNSVGGKSWALKLGKTKASIKDVIADMAAVNKNRLSRREIPYKNDDYLEKMLEESFPYTETGDQSEAIREIYLDMNTPGLMDRIIIGDVGFGKTEVALRAAGKAVFSNVLVMVVAPTTILANQHFILFKNRLEKFGVVVEMVSRFIKQKKLNEIINNVLNNKIDLLVGTHKLLGDEIPKKRLGLVIIDDEHRFGVVHKNKLLKLKQSVDVLTLTATPIPRTLQQSLLGLKSVSLINTPPVKKLPIKTQVLYHNWNILKNIMEMELNRGGQVYFLNNRIESMQFYEKKIAELLPGNNIVSAHGKMNSSELEKNIISFYEGKINVLITTTIVEAGLDIPNANTIIITASHMYGLSQLYQIRGRVGRGDRQGFCYLIIPKNRSLTKEAVERLKTIQENTDLGSGYKIAIKDLELRGAGNVFGYDQSGHVSNVGYHLYCKMFNDALKKSKKEDDGIFVPKIQYFGDASFKDSYIPLSQDRLYYYQRLSASKTKQEVNAVQEEITDRYGKPGPGAKNLFIITATRAAYIQTIVKNILIEKDKAVFTLMSVDPKTKKETPVGNLINALEELGIKHEFKQSKKQSLLLEILCDLGDDPLTIPIRNAELFYFDNNNS